MQLMASETTNEGSNQTGFSKTVIEFCSNTSAHGLGGVANSSSRKGRLLWLCIVLVAFGVCFQGSFKLIERFLKFDVSVDVITVREQSLRFPAITICNMNRFKKSKILGTKLDNITKEIFQRSMEANESLDVLQWRVISFDLTKEYRRMNTSTLSSYAHHAKDIIVSCKGPGSTMNYKCNHNNFTQVFISHHGNCFTINGIKRKQNITVQDSGPMHGITMILNIEADEYTENPLLYGQGIAMDIHDPDISTWLHRKAPKITLAAGSSTSIGLRVRKEVRLPSPYGGGDCKVPENDRIDGQMYSEEVCLYKCQNNALEKACGCSLAENTESKICDLHNTTQEFCVADASYNYEGDGILPFCRRHCSPACSEERFETIISSVPWPSNATHPVLKSLVTAMNHSAQHAMEDLHKTRENLLIVDVYFETLVREIVSQKSAYTPGDLFSNIGGIVGLCAGVSILTGVEFIVFGIKLCGMCIQWYIKKKKVQSAPSTQETKWAMDISRLPREGQTGRVNTTSWID